jgi:hypothetical protein
LRIQWQGKAGFYATERYKRMDKNAPSTKLIAELSMHFATGKKKRNTSSILKLFNGVRSTVKKQHAIYS